MLEIIIHKVYSTIIGCNTDIWQNYRRRNNTQIWLQFMLYDAPSAFILYKAILFSIHNSRIACFPWCFALKLRNACHYKLAYTETLKIKIISNLQNENAQRFSLQPSEYSLSSQSERVLQKLFLC